MECGNGKADRADRFPTTEGVLSRAEGENESGKAAQVFATITLQPYKGQYFFAFLQVEL